MTLHSGKLKRASADKIALPPPSPTPFSLASHTINGKCVSGRRAGRKMFELLTAQLNVTTMRAVFGVVGYLGS